VDNFFIFYLYKILLRGNTDESAKLLQLTHIVMHIYRGYIEFPTYNKGSSIIGLTEVADALEVHH
jgi:hypothetical protein